MASFENRATPYDPGNPVIAGQESTGGVITVRLTNPSDCYDMRIVVPRLAALQLISDAPGEAFAEFQVGFSISYGSPAPVPTYIGETISFNFVNLGVGYSQAGTWSDPGQRVGVLLPDVPPGDFVECKTRIRCNQAITTGPNLTYGILCNEGMAIWGWAI